LYLHLSCCRGFSETWGTGLECCGIQDIGFLMYNVPNDSELLIHLTLGISTHKWDRAYVVSCTGLLELLAFSYMFAVLHQNCRIGCTAIADSTFDTLNVLGGELAHPQKYSLV
jgi:hypothetical protein